MKAQLGLQLPEQYTLRSVATFIVIFLFNHLLFNLWFEFAQFKLFSYNL